MYTGCPLGDSSSLLVRVGEYARVSLVDVLLGLLSYNNKFSTRIYVADLLRTFRFWDEEENGYKIFS